MANLRVCFSGIACSGALRRLLSVRWHLALREQAPATRRNLIQYQQPTKRPGQRVKRDQQGRVVREAGEKIEEMELMRGMRIHAPVLRAYIGRHIPVELQRAIAPEDVLQDTWASAFKNLASFRADEPNAMERWLTAIAKRRVVDAIKRAARLKRGGEHRFEYEADHASSLVGLFDSVASAGRTPSGEAAIAEALDAVQIAVASLPPARKQAIWMRHIEGRSLHEIAESMGRTAAAVNSLLFHGLQQLSERLGSADRYLSDAASSQDTSGD